MVFGARYGLQPKKRCCIWGCPEELAINVSITCIDNDKHGFIFGCYEFLISVQGFFFSLTMPCCQFALLRKTTPVEKHNTIVSDKN